MTAVHIRRIGRAGLSMPRRALIGAGLSVVVGCLAGAASHDWSQSASAQTLAVATPRNAAQLIQATSGVAATEVKAVGGEARLINAGMPFNAGPVRAAAAFTIGTGDAVDYRRALLCLTQAVYYEAGFEPMAGRRAVAQVVLNRLRHPAFPKSLCGVVYQGSRSPVCQFSFVCDGALYRRPAAVEWKQAEDIARAALAGYVETSVGSATHYHADYVAPYWAPLLAKIVKVGAHIFYRWPGAWGQPAAFTGHYVGEPNDPLALRPALRQAVLRLPGTMVTNLPVVEAGPPVSRAKNDVGGLLDTSKGWKLNIPMPEESSSAASTIALQQERAKVAPTAPAGHAIAQGGAPLIASR